mgnify:CR=1 FL=1
MPNERVTFRGVEEVKLVEMEETGNYRLEIKQLRTENGRSVSQESTFRVCGETAEVIKDIAEYREDAGNIETNFPEKPVHISGGLV